MADVPITQKPIESQSRRFDPKNLPTPGPPLQPGEAGVTVCDFSCEAEFDIEGTPTESPTEEGCEVTLTASVAAVTIDLTITIWLPEDADEQLTAHEDGHADICKEVYDGAKQAAADAAKAFGKRTFTGKGKKCEDAKQAAIDMAVGAFCNDYGARTRAVDQRVSDIYDDLTDKGKKAEPKPKDAVKKAFKKYKDEKEKEKEKGQKK
ncbi:MAG TPA: hypothetical protein VKU19_25045 [Bryobacteraceae bacterium]|nr:hypothetical protein [Bryobacteraceae bacterium]